MKKYIKRYALFSIIMLIIGLICEYLNAVTAGNKAYSTSYWFLNSWQFAVFLPIVPLSITFLLCLIELVKKHFLKIKQLSNLL